MTTVLFSAPPTRWAEYEQHLRHAFAKAGLSVDLATNHAPETVDYVVYAPSSGLIDFEPFGNLKAVLGLWAGVEDIVGNDTIKVPLARMIDPGLSEGMVEWVLGHVLRYHLGIDQSLASQNGTWDRRIPPLARSRCVGVLGLGALGASVATALAALHFKVCGWSRALKSLPDVECLSGLNGLKTVLERSEILVTLLPLTPQTENTLDAEALGLLPRGARLINPGRGGLIDDAALLAALDAGHVDHATLDVFRAEPLPSEHPYWDHPRVTVTPHIASETRPETAARVIADNIRRGEAGLPLLHLVDRDAGY